MLGCVGVLTFLACGGVPLELTVPDSSVKTCEEADSDKMVCTTSYCGGQIKPSFSCATVAHTHKLPSRPCSRLVLAPVEHPH